MTNTTFLDGEFELPTSVNRQITSNMKKANKGYEAMWGKKEKIAYYACYAGLNHYVTEKDHKYIFHTLGAIDNDIFDYKALLKRLNKMYAKTFTIKYQKTNNKKIWVIKVTEKKNLKLHNLLLQAAYQQLFGLFRAMNSEHIDNREHIPKNRLPIKRVWELVEVFNRYLQVRSGHGLNDNLWKIRQGDEEIFKAACQQWAKTIRDIYGRTIIDWNNKELKDFLAQYKDNIDRYGFRHTAQFDFLEELAERFV